MGKIPGLEYKSPHNASLVARGHTALAVAKVQVAAPELVPKQVMSTDKVIRLVESITHEPMSKRSRALYTPPVTPRNAERKRRWRKDHPERHAAHQTLHRAVAAGRIIRPDECPRCGVDGRISAHHRDYSKPLEVEWLCEPCHVAEHRDLVDVAGVRSDRIPPKKAPARQAGPVAVGVVVGKMTPAQRQARWRKAHPKEHAERQRAARARQKTSGKTQEAQ